MEVFGRLGSNFFLFDRNLIFLLNATKAMLLWFHVALFFKNSRIILKKSTEVLT